MHKLFGCSHVSPLSAPARPAPAPGPGGGRFGTQRSVPDGDGEQDESITRRGLRRRLQRHRCHRRRAFPLSALATRSISAFSPLRHPTRRQSGDGATSRTAAHAVLIVPWLPPAHACTPPHRSPKPNSLFFSPEPGSRTTSPLPTHPGVGQPHGYGPTAPVPPTPILLFFSLCCFPLCLLLLPPRSAGRSQGVRTRRPRAHLGPPAAAAE